MRIRHQPVFLACLLALGGIACGPGSGGGASDSANQIILKGKADIPNHLDKNIPTLVYFGADW